MQASTLPARLSSKGTVATASYQLQGGEHFTNPNSIGSKDHCIPENIRHAYRTAPGKNVNGVPMEMEELQINLRDKALLAVRAGVVDVLNAFYSLNVEQLATCGARSGVSSTLIKQLSEFAGVFQRDTLSKKDRRWKYTGSQHHPIHVSFNHVSGNWMWKAIVELLRVISLQMNAASAALAVPWHSSSSTIGRR